MDFGRDRMRMNGEGDRLSGWSDDLIHKILSFISIKHAIETNVLSSRWRFIWTTMPYLNFSSEDFPTLPKFSKFVTHVLCGRNNLIEVSSAKLSFRGKVSQMFVKKIMNYALLHNIQQLTVEWLLENENKFPLSLFSSQSLKHLSLINKVSKSKARRFTDSYIITPTSTWELPALTTLYLHDVAFCNDNTDECIDLFSKCTNLKDLTLNRCRMMGSNGFRICHHLLSNLTLVDKHWSVKAVNVVTPQLKNLTIRNWSKELLICAPDLASLPFNGCHPLHLSTNGFRSLEKADLCISYPDEKDVHKIIFLLEQLRSVKFFTLNLEIVELLSSHVELISRQPPPFSKLKSLKIYPSNVYLKEAPNMSTEVKNYLLDSSPSATSTIVSREEIRAARNAASAQDLIAELRVLLEHEKANTNRAHTERGKAPLESHKSMMHGQGKTQVENQRAQPAMKIPPHIGGMLTQIKSCLEDLTRQIGEGKANACRIISKLQQFEGLLTELPTSKRATIQECFYSLCAEADTIVNKTINGMKFQCDMKRSHVTLYFHELSTASQLSS